MLTQLFYDQDFHQWLEKTIDQLEQKDFNNLDIDHLIEELKDWGKSDKNVLESNVVVSYRLEHYRPIFPDTIIEQVLDLLHRKNWYF